MPTALLEDPDFAEHVKAFTLYVRSLDRDALTTEDKAALRALKTWLEVAIKQVDEGAS